MFSLDLGLVYLVALTFPSDAKGRCRERECCYLLAAGRLRSVFYRVNIAWLSKIYRPAEATPRSRLIFVLIAQSLCVSMALASVENTEIKTALNATEIRQPLEEAIWGGKATGGCYHVLYCNTASIRESMLVRSGILGAALQLPVITD